jgi:hypothetical protein
VGSILGIKVRAQFTFGYVAERLPVNGAQSSLVYLVMKDDRERLSHSSWQDATELHMTAALGSRLEAEAGKDAEKILP